jgi:hypothetical protein
MLPTGLLGSSNRGSDGRTRRDVTTQWRKLARLFSRVAAAVAADVRKERDRYGPG